MPKANEAKNTKVTAVADPKNVETSEETKIAAPEQAAEKPVDAAEKKDEAAEKTKAAPVAKETKTRGPRKTAERSRLLRRARRSRRYTSSLPGRSTRYLPLWRR